MITKKGIKSCYDMVGFVYDRNSDKNIKCNFPHIYIDVGGFWCIYIQNS